MSVCARVCVHGYVCACACTCVCARVFVCMSVRARVCVHVRVHAHVRATVHVTVHSCVAVRRHCRETKKSIDETREELLRLQRRLEALGTLQARGLAKSVGHSLAQKEQMDPAMRKICDELLVASATSEGRGALLVWVVGCLFG